MHLVERFTSCLVDATRSAARKLFSPGSESFYYFALVMTDEALPCFISSWSYEALAKVGDPLLKWSYADSPYCAFGWEEFFSPVRNAYANRPTMDSLSSDAWDSEFQFRLRGMEDALRILDREGLFGVDSARNQIFVHAEVVPPDPSSIERAKRLNPQAAIVDWLNEAADVQDYAT